jgi:hypothetical protein
VDYVPSGIALEDVCGSLAILSKSKICETLICITKGTSRPHHVKDN